MSSSNSPEPNSRISSSAEDSHSQPQSPHLQPPLINGNADSSSAHSIPQGFSPRGPLVRREEIQAEVHVVNAIVNEANAVAEASGAPVRLWENSDDEEPREWVDRLMHRFSHDSTSMAVTDPSSSSRAPRSLTLEEMMSDLRELSDTDDALEESTCSAACKCSNKESSAAFSYTLLQDAAETGCVFCVQRLMMMVDKVDDSGRHTPLSLSIINEHLDCVRILGSHGNLEERSLGRTPLQAALGTGNKDIIRQLVEYGADVNQYLGTTYSKASSIFIDKEAIVEMLLSNWVETNPAQGDNLENLPAMVADIWSDDNNLQLETTTYFWKLLSIENSPPINEVVQSGVITRFIEFLARDDYPLIQFEAAWALTNIASGTSENVRAVIDNKAVPIFVRLLESITENVCKQAVRALGTISQNSLQCRDLVLECLVRQECIRPLCGLLTCPDQRIVKFCLQGLEYILKVGEAERTGDFAKLIENAEGLEKIELLQSHENKEMYEKAVEILEAYWMVIEDDPVLPGD